jgi:hypothetical protein
MAYQGLKLGDGGVLEWRRPSLPPKSLKVELPFPALPGRSNFPHHFPSRTQLCAPKSGRIPRFLPWARASIIEADNQSTRATTFWPDDMKTLVPVDFSGRRSQSSLSERPDDIASKKRRLGDDMKTLVPS